jgi:hypothetical protein
MQRLSEIWQAGRAPGYVRAVLGAVRMMGAAPVSGGLRMAWNEAGEMRATLAKLDA